MSNLKAALYYKNNLKFSVIPVGLTKKPLIEWKEFQSRLPTDEEIIRWWTKTPDANIGVVTGKISGVVVIDLDSKDAVDEFSKFLPPASNAVRSLTPRGVHHWFIWPGFEVENRTGLLPGCDLRGDGGFVVVPPSKNSTGKYSWEVPPISGCREPLPQGILKLLSLERSIYVPPAGSMFTEGRRDSDLFHTAMMLARGKMPETEIREILGKLATSCVPPFSVEEAQAKVDSAIQRAKVREHGIKQSVTEWLEVAFGRFSVKDVAMDLGLQNTEDRNKLSVTISRMADEGIIERIPGFTATYRKKDEEIDELDYKHITGDFIDLKWPFQIEDLILTMPKNVAIIAGESNAGKTAFMLNLVKMNQHKFDVHYFSSEMGAIEFNTRLKKFGAPMESWRFHAYERSDGFHDVIVPTGLNIIDFLEIYEEFYRVGWFIKKIYDALTTGVAVIAIQKNPKTDLGLGGMRGIEKSRLYLSMFPGEVKIIKAKNWKTELNPNGLSKRFKLVNGWEIRDCTNWERTKNEFM